MMLRKRLLCLVFALAVCSTVTALADAAVEDFWNYAYGVDRTIYVNASDGLGLYMRNGPDTSYSKVNARTIPNGTAVHITRECTAENGWKWGWCSYQFPGRSEADSGWACLVETTTQPPTAAPAPAPAPQETQPAQAEEPAPQEETAQEPARETEPVTEEEAAEAPEAAEASAEDVQSAPAEASAPAENAGTYNSMSLVIIGVVIGAAAAAAVLLIVTKRKR